MPVTTRIATSDDVPALVDLWAELSQLSGRASVAVDPAMPTGDVTESLAAAVADPHCQVVVACAQGTPVGMAVLSTVEMGPLSRERAVQLDHVVVSGAARRRGVGHALVAAGAAYAEELGVEHVVVSLYPGMREASRFYARLGFAPLVVRRIAAVPALRRRLADADRRGSVEQLIRRRAARRLPPQRDSLAAARR